MVGRAVRDHWGIESRLHWVLNVTFAPARQHRRHRDEQQTGKRIYSRPAERR